LNEGKAKIAFYYEIYHQILEVKPINQENESVSIMFSKSIK